jgi:VIT1/CCC1 family predicted Fe2+/Mn2+ transporter
MAVTEMAVDTRSPQHEDHSFLLQKVQPALTGLMDGSLSTIAPIFAIALASRNPHYAFIAGLATSFGAAISMAFAEGLSDTGELTGRGNPAIRGAITGVGTFLGGILHTLPFLLPQYHAALAAAAAVVAVELVALAYVRVHFFKIGFVGSVLSVTLAGALIAVVSALLGAAG